MIYQFIFDHIGRTAGKRSWGDKSPRYIFKDNKLIQKGFFSDFPFKIIMKLRKNFYKELKNIKKKIKKIKMLNLLELKFSCLLKWAISDFRMLLLCLVLAEFNRL